MSELVGHKLGKYTLEAQLGAGGMATVYRSRHPQFDRPVAIKILPPTIGQDASFRARFEREGRMIAGLNHPNIIRVYDIDEAGGLFYMVMDLLPGGTLESRLREGGLDRRWSADVIVKMAEALDYAHTRGVIHRDIKPSNILLDADGQPVLADFGIARAAQAESEPSLTAAGMVMGTPAYMAPEQLNGGQPDARSDIYSLGVVLYQLLAGRAPFTGDTMAVVTAHLTKLPQPLRELVPDLPPAVDAVVLQALAKQPEHRFKSAGVFAQALRGAAADLEPGLVRVASSARSLAAAPGPAAPTIAPASAPAAPPTAGQQVARYLPVALGVLGLLLVISVIAKYWALVALLALLLGGGGFLFLYLRASSQGRKAAQETTRAITTATIRAALPPDSPASPAPAPAATPIVPTPAMVADATLEAPATATAGQSDDVPEFPLPDEPTLTLDTAPEQSEPELALTEAVPAEHAELAPTEAVPATPTAEPATAAESAAGEAAELAPTEAIPSERTPSATSELAPTEAVLIAENDQPTEALPHTTAPAEPDQPREG
jgi:serine/threonine-protein kinase